MTRYKLPDVLGGAEVFVVQGCTEGCPGRVVVGVLLRERPTGITIEVDRSILVEVEPPEPPNGTVLRTRTLSPAVYQRSDQGCDTEGAWWATGDEVPVRWEAIAHLEFERLVPAPEPVELPWLLGGVQVQQTTDNDKPSDRVLVSTKNASYGFVHFDPTTAREMARALWTAADQAEAAEVTR